MSKATDHNEKTTNNKPLLPWFLLDRDIVGIFLTALIAISVAIQSYVASQQIELQKEISIIENKIEIIEEDIKQSQRILSNIRSISMSINNDLTYFMYKFNLIDGFTQLYQISNQYSAYGKPVNCRPIEIRFKNDYNKLLNRCILGPANELNRISGFKQYDIWLKKNLHLIDENYWLLGHSPFPSNQNNGRDSLMYWEITELYHSKRNAVADTFSEYSQYNRFLIFLIISWTVGLAFIQFPRAVTAWKNSGSEVE